MTFDDWYQTKNSKYHPTDDNLVLRTLRDCWNTAQAEQREADAKICEEIKHPLVCLTVDGRARIVAAIRSSK